MSDTLELWRLCPHGQGPAHRYSIDTGYSSQGNLLCSGGKKYIMRKIGPTPTTWKYYEVVWVEVTDG